MAVTADELEQPVAVVDTPAELAAIFGTTKEKILEAIVKGTIKKVDNVKFIRVTVDDWDYTIG